VGEEFSEGERGNVGEWRGDRIEIRKQAGLLGSSQGPILENVMSRPSKSRRGSTIRRAAVAITDEQIAGLPLGVLGVGLGWARSRHDILVV